MYIDSIILLVYLACLLLLSSFVVYLYYTISKNQRIYNDINKFQNTSRIIQDIQNRSKLITEEAVRQARIHLNETEDIKQDLVKNLENSFRQIEENTQRLMQDKAAVFDSSYHDLLAQIRTEVEKSKQALTDTQLIKQDLIKEIEETIRKVGDRAIYYLEQESVEFDKQYKQVLSRTLEEYRAKAANSLSLLEKIPENQLSDFKSLMLKETLESEQLLNKKISEEYEKVKGELDRYREEQLKKIDKSMNKIILKVAEEVLGHAISAQEHEDLILDALERAKREDVLKV